MTVFVDSNIPMYVAGRAHPNRAAARRFLERVRRGDVDACTSSEVLQEILYRYIGLERPDLARRVYDLFVQVCPIVYPVTLVDTDRAKELVCGGVEISVRDAVHAAVMFSNDIPEIATFDTGFDGIDGIERVPLD